MDMLLFEFDDFETSNILVFWSVMFIQIFILIVQYELISQGFYISLFYETQINCKHSHNWCYINEREFKVNINL